MHFFGITIANLHLTLAANSMNNSQTQASRTFFLGTLIKTLEDAVLVQRLRNARIAETDGRRRDFNVDDTFIYIMYKLPQSVIQTTEGKKDLKSVS